MKKRLNYEVPETELFVVRFEENFLDSLTNTTSSTLNGRFVGGSGSAGNPNDPNDFDGGSIDL